MDSIECERPPRADLYAAIHDRRSIRRYRPDEVPRETMRRLLGAATAAPSAHNRQPWRFVLLSTTRSKTMLAEAMGHRLEADRRRDGDDAESIRRDVQRSFERITSAPAIVLVCLTLEDMDCYVDAERNRAEFLMAVQSTAMAVQNLLLAAHAEGLGTCLMCAPLFCGEIVRAVLGLPEVWQPQALVTLGHAAGPGRVRGRKPLDEVVLGLDRPS